MYKKVPTWSNGVWSHTIFEEKEEFRQFLLPLFKEPGKYEFDETSFLFNEMARKYVEYQLYCDAPLKTTDYRKFWDTEKDKCRNGVIFKHHDKTWYITRDYYMWLNYLPIFNKEIADYGFADFRDAQYHIALYEHLAELSNKHSGIVKKRQIASSYFHMGKLINQLWFEKGVTMKIGASHKDYINEKGSWKMLTEYKSWLNEKTAWYRPMTPDKTLMWQQQVEITLSNRKSMKGNKGVIQGLTFDKDPTNGVGGPCRYFFYEEAGIAPTMDTTVEYLFPAMKTGFNYNGMFIAAGSVGDLDQCNPLKKMIRYPEKHDIYPVFSNLLDEKGTTGYSGLFIPEQWSMPPYIDKYGNSLVEAALEALNIEFARWKRELAPETYQLRVSQHPRNIEEAFAFKKVSVFPLHLVGAQQRRIEDKEYGFELLDLSRDENGKVKADASHKLPISTFPIDPAKDNKEGVLVVWERPVPDTKFGRTYFGSIDPVGEGKTTTSDSLCSLYILKSAVEVTKIDSGTSVTYIEQDKIVASWCGRFDDINKTHEMLELIMEWYSALTVYENNVTGFIQYLKGKNKIWYLATKDQMLFLKEAQANQNVHQEYGWKNVGQVFKQHMLNYGVDYCSEELDRELKTDGTIARIKYGVERIPDPMLLKEMIDYEPGLNVDRITAYCALIAFYKLRQANFGLDKRTENLDKNLDKSKNLFKLDKRSPFRNIGTGGYSSVKPFKSPFRNIK